MKAVLLAALTLTLAGGALADNVTPPASTAARGILTIFNVSSEAAPSFGYPQKPNSSVTPPNDSGASEATFVGCLMDYNKNDRRPWPGESGGGAKPPDFVLKDASSSNDQGKPSRLEYVVRSEKVNLRSLVRHQVELKGRLVDNADKDKATGNSAGKSAGPSNRQHRAIGEQGREISVTAARSLQAQCPPAGSF